MTALTELVDMVAALRAAGLAEYEGPVLKDGYDYSCHSFRDFPQVRLKLRAMSDAPEPEAKPADPPPKVDAIEALEARFFPPNRVT